MTIQDGLKLLQSFKETAKDDGDPFFVIHFSRVDDKYEGDFDGLDVGDALIIIEKLCTKFDINPEIAASAYQPR